MKTKLTYSEIYQKYKHGEVWRTWIPKPSTTRVYRALKRHGLIVVKVKNKNGKWVVFNYVPEINRFEQLTW